MALCPEATQMTTSRYLCIPGKLREDRETHELTLCKLSLSRPGSPDTTGLQDKPPYAAIKIFIIHDKKSSRRKTRIGATH